MAEGKENFPRRQERVIYGVNKQRTSKQDNTNRGRRPQKPQKPQNKEKRKQKSRRSLPRKQMLLGLGFIIILIIIYLFVRKNGTEVFVGSESVGVLEGRAVKAETIVDTIETQLAGMVGAEVKLNEEVKAQRIHIGGSRKKDICTMEHLIPKIRNLVTYKVDAAIIMIDGGKGVVLANEEQANNVLDSVKKPYLPAEGVEATVEWVENVTVAKDFVDSEEVLSESDAVSILQSTTTVTSTYTVQSNDALYKIAQSYECSLEDLLKLNDGLSVETGIRVGQVLNVPVKKPKVSVKTVETQVLTTVEPKTYEYHSDNTKPKSYQKVTQQGRAGQKKSTIQITRINGFVQEEKEISKEIISEPVPEIIVRGTL
ncbi:G5 domain-containing protein [Anaerotignum sp. MB30-C6]|uniref:G5 domain-containing protein n=1 Tax=Anaerotignum sp. MB30-C6 TaxID=3070814 RepID=UPI0027DB1181|nr:G5 domain-containing protein [Anaerotignum sp. MB30-C6]WMI80855.1 G5 domain-containing protein [Anaerotignum sp. MB30-C6]